MDGESDVSRVRYFPVSVTKLVVMSVCTFGLYEIYWAWNCWEYIKSRDGRDLNPFWRSVHVLALYFNFPLIWDVSRSAGDSRAVALARTVICGCGFALLWGGGSLAGNSPLVLATLLSIAMLVPVQKQINELNRRDAPDHDPNRRFSNVNVVIVVVGGLFLSLAVLGSFLQPR